MSDWDVVVVGGGSAGCALAGRLSEDPSRRVLVLEAGRAPFSETSFPDEVRAASSLAASDPGNPYTWAFRTELLPERPQTIARGRLLGGSSAINGANHVWATPADVEGWPGWSYADAVHYYRRCEDDRDVAGGGHGHEGPVPVVRPAGERRAGITDRFVEAATAIGVPAEPDKNAGAPPGVGPIPANVRRGVRVNAAMAYLLPHRDRANLEIRGDAEVAGLVLDDDRAVGVRLLDGSVVEAGEVVLAAGSVKSPHLLALSGIGPADVLRAAGIDVHADRPGVGQGWSDHPTVYLGFPYDEDLHPEAVGSQAAVHLDSGDDPAGDLEILLFARPFAPGGARHLMCALQRPDSRGSTVLASPDPRDPPRVAHHYLASGHDRSRLRAAVRAGCELLRAGRLAVPRVADADDAALDAWVAANLTTSAHLCGSARMGTADDPGAVVDPALRVHGIRGLRVVDTSVLPTVPRRGPAATALMLGEWAADLMTERARVV